MSYTTYTTDAIVCGTFDRNTADRSYRLFTREAGMLFASARSVRKETSRQRYALQDFSLVRVSLIRGKAGWKIGSIEARQNYYNEACDKAARGSVVVVFRLLRRFLQGEEPAPELFDFVLECIGVLASEQGERTFVERVVQLRLLAMLGYVSQKNIPPEIQTVSPEQFASVSTEDISVKISRQLALAESASQL